MPVRGICALSILLHLVLWCAWQWTLDSEAGTSLAFCKGQVGKRLRRGKEQRSAGPLSVAESVAPQALAVPSPGELRRLLYARPASKQSAPWGREVLEAAYESCRQVTEEHSKSFYFASQFLAPAEQRAIWAIYDWCRVTDELVDGPKAESTSMADLEAWQAQLHKTFRLQAGSEDPSALALMDAVHKFSLIEKPFDDMIAGMAMDLTMDRYRTFEELEVYCYRVAGTVGLMSMPVLGTDPRRNSNIREKEATISAAMSLGLAFQLTNILRDIGEDARRGRIYVPLEDLQSFGISEEEVLAASQSQGLLYHERRWRDFMDFQIDRCLEYYRKAEQGIVGLSEGNQLAVLAALHVYEGILGKIRSNGYDNLSQRAFVPSHEKLLLLGRAFWRLWELRASADEAATEGGARAWSTARLSQAKF